MKIFSRICSLVLLSCLGTGRVHPQEVGSKNSTKDLLLNEARRLAQGPGVDLGAGLDETRPETRSALQDPGVMHLSETVRDILILFITRGLADQLPPADLADRLTDRGLKYRERMIAHAREIAKRAIPDPIFNPPAQANLSRPGGKAERQATTAEVSRVKAAVDYQLDQLDRGNLTLRWVMAINREEIRAAVPFTIEQRELARRLDRATRDILIAWIKRGMSANLPASELLDRVTRQREETIAHADAILLQGIFAPEQAERFLKAYWATLGLASLLEPELAARLNITKNQKNQIKEVLAQKDQVSRELAQKVGASMAFTRTPEEIERGRSVQLEIQARLSEVEQDVWDILNVNQAGKVKEIFGGALKPPLPNRVKRPSGRPRPG